MIICQKTFFIFLYYFQILILKHITFQMLYFFIYKQANTTLIYIWFKLFLKDGLIYLGGLSWEE